MMLGGGIPRQSLRSWIEVLPGIDARLGQVGRAKAIPRDVLVERPPAAGDLFVLAYDEASRLYFETVLVKRKPRLLCQGQLFSLESTDAPAPAPSLTALGVGSSTASIRYTTPLPGVDRSTGQDVVFEFPVQE
jgi:hypothetical protein